MFSALDAERFQECFTEWVRTVSKITEGQIVAIDGKTVRRSHDSRAGRSAIHVVSAWASANRLALGQTRVDDKSNEITAIPKLSDCWRWFEDTGGGVENSAHWTLDVSFGEDDSRVSKDNGAEMFAALRRMALDMLKRENSLRVGIAAKRKRAGWDHDYLLKALAQ